MIINFIYDLINFTAIFVFTNSLMLLFFHYLNLFKYTNFIFFTISTLIFTLINFLILKIKKYDLIEPEKETKIFLILLFIIIISCTYIFRISEVGILSNNDSHSYLSYGLNITSKIKNKVNIPPYLKQSFIEVPRIIQPSLVLYPLWLGFVTNNIGIKYTFYINTIFLLLSIFLLHNLFSKYFTKKISLIGIILLLINTGIILTSKTLLREIPCLFIFLIFLNKYYDNNKVNDIVVPISFFLCLYLRPELSFIVIVLLFDLFTDKNKNINRIIYLFICLGSFLILNIKDNITYFSYDFLFKLFERFRLIVIFSPLLLIFTYLMFRYRDYINKTKNKIIITILVINVVLFFVFYYVRSLYFYKSIYLYKSIEVLIKSNLINFDWISLQRLGLFIPIIILLYYPIGLLILYVKQKIKLPVTYILFLSVFSLLFIWSPFHEPNLRFWIRRYVVVTIPFFIIISIQSYFILIKNKYLLLFLVLAIIVSGVLIDYHTLYFKEYDGLYSQILSLSEKYKNKKAIILSDDNLDSDYKLVDTIANITNNWSVVKYSKIKIQYLQPEKEDVYLVTIGKQYWSNSVDPVDIITISFKRLEWSYITNINNIVDINIPIYVYKI